MGFLSGVACDSHHVNTGQYGHQRVPDEIVSYSDQFEIGGLLIETCE